MDTQQDELYRRVIQIMPELKSRTRTDLYIKISNSKKNYVVYDKILSQ